MAHGYFRFPDVHGDLIAVCAADDVWLVPVGGGRAWRFSTDEAPVRQPRFSPDGRWLAWASTRDGAFDVYVAPVDGGDPRRLTYWGHPTTSVLGWTADGRVLVASAAGAGNLRQVFTRAVGLDGRIELLPYGPASGVAVGEAGVVVSTPHSRPPADWKRYRGGTAAKLWWSPSGDGWTRLFRDLTAGLANPSWVGDRLVFASDHLAELPGPADEVANLFSIGLDRLPTAAEAPTPTADDLRQHTSHDADRGYVRDPVTDGTRIVYHAYGTVYLMDDLDSDPEPVEIGLPAVAGRAPRLLDPAKNLTALRPDQHADGSVVEWRGKAFYLTHREGPSRALAAESGVRVRDVHPLSLARAVMVTDGLEGADGEDALLVTSTTGEVGARPLAGGRLGRVLSLAPSPAGDRVAVVSHDGRVSLVECGDPERDDPERDDPERDDPERDGNREAEVRTVTRSADGEVTGLAFSPDGRYLVWSEPVGWQHRRLVLADLSADHAEPVALTSGNFVDTSPAFTADGKHLAFLSTRTFDPVYDAHVFNLMFAAGTRPYLIPLSATDPAPFGPGVNGWPLIDAKDRDSAQARTADDDEPAEPEDRPWKDGTATAEVDLDGFEERLVAFPVPAGRYRELRASATGVSWIHERAEQGVLGSSRAGLTDDPPGDALGHFDLAARKLETVADKVDDYALSGDGRRVLVRHQAKVTVGPADKRVDGDDPGRVDVDLDRLRFELEPVAEWRQMVAENARLMRDFYWREDLDGIDLAALQTRYLGLVDRLCSHDDLVALLWEFGAEFNTSHAYTSPPAPPGDQRRRVGFLGADLSPAGDDGWVIDRILPGESSDPQARSPLRAPGVGARAGMRITGVDGRPVDSGAGPAASLLGAADRPVELLLTDPDGDPAGARRVVVVPLADEESLRYQDWVAGRRRYVAEHGGGRLGYVHVPDMMAPGWAQLHRDLDRATRAEGLVVDVRYNRGGHISQLVVERLARRVQAWGNARHIASAEEYPSLAPRGPVIFVANEWSGSDGDIVNAVVQAMGVGPVVGTRTWGGVVGIDGRFDLVDGTGVTQPRYPFWISGYGWGVENHGVDPDIEVEMTPADWFSGADPQLDRAIAEAFDRLASTPAATPPEMPPPRVRPPRVRPNP